MSAEKVIIGNAELWHGDCREVLPMFQGQMFEPEQVKEEQVSLI